MSEQGSPQTRNRLRRISLGRNPVAIKELRSRMRGRRAFVVLTLYLAMMSGLIFLVYIAFSASTSSPTGLNSRQAGKAVFVSVLVVQSFLVIFIGPAFTSAALSGEKERQIFRMVKDMVFLNL